MNPLLKQLYEKAENIRRRMNQSPEELWLEDVLDEVEEEIERLEDGE